jgi:iron complex transport system substrate-binding protein
VRAVLAASSLCALALLLSACGERAEPTGASVRLYPVTVSDASGSQVSLSAAPRRILAVGSEMAATLRALGAGSRTVTTGGGITGGSPNYDLVAAWSSSQGVSALGQRPGATNTYVASDRSIGEVERSLSDLGVLVGRPLAGDRLVTGIERAVRAAQQRVQNERPVSVFLDKGFFTTVSRQTLQGEMISVAGGRSVAPTAATGGPVDPRALRRLDPRYYLATSGSGTTLQRLRRDPATKNLRAVRAGRFGIVPDRLLEPGPNVGAGVAAIARILHPDAFR